MSFETLGLSAELLRAVTDQGYTEPTPIQAQAIPVVLEGRDLMGGAQTGTGKTAGFTLPLLQLLSVHANTSTSPAKHPVRALILTPTRELAAQVEESVQTYGKYLPLKSTVVFGGVNIKEQIAALKGGVEILVATPGRLLDHVEQKTVNLSKVEILVLDEADRMLDMGFLPDIKRIIALLPAKRQNLLFSATFAGEIKKLSDQLLTDPVLIEVARRNAASENVTQVIYPVDHERKRELLAHLIKSENLQQVLVFSRTKHGASRLAQQLEKDGISATAIHGDKSQQQRTQALMEFKAGTVRVLVATDVAARGLDIDQLPHVVNFDLPNAPEDYVHRIGRTGRAGSSGEAISLVCADELRMLAEIESMLKRELPRIIVPGFEPGAAAQIAARAGFADRPRREPRPAEHSRNREGRDGREGRSAPSRPPVNPLDAPYVTPPIKQEAVQPASTSHANPRQTVKKPIPALLMRPATPTSEGN
ncbi:MAG: DEAD/DEAH box helicase [Gammaproteobacteria bacterium]|nr:DEAD/DEAH box helicase [Gammaproteobacteria bacterium]